MTADAPVPEPSGAAAPWARLLDRHRERWAAEVLHRWSVLDLAEADDPAQAIGDASPETAFVWLDGYHEAEDRDRLRAAIAAASDRNAPIVIGLDADREGHGQREAEALLNQLANGRVVTQELAAGSVIGAEPSDEAAARRRSVHLLVCANVDLAGSSADVRPDVEPLMTGYVAWLEQANRELRAANTRLGRESLGRHDAAAAAVIQRQADLEARIADLEKQVEQERSVAAENHRLLLEAKGSLLAPRYRFVDALRDLAFSLPGVSTVLRLRSRRVRDRWRPPE